MSDILSLTEAAKAVPALDGKRPHVASIFRWAKSGIKRGAMTVTLRYVRVGRRIGIPREALDEFFVALAEADRAADASPIEREAAKCRAPVTKGRTPAQRAKAIERARKELAAAGI
ncbi:MAG: DUF1580 domain-containing protein [Planctomycetota bacterium]